MDSKLFFIGVICFILLISCTNQIQTTEASNDTSLREDSIWISDDRFNVVQISSDLILVFSPYTFGSSGDSILIFHHEEKSSSGSKKSISIRFRDRFQRDRDIIKQPYGELSDQNISYDLFFTTKLAFIPYQFADTTYLIREKGQISFPNTLLDLKPNCPEMMKEKGGQYYADLVNELAGEDHTIIATREFRKRLTLFQCEKEFSHFYLENRLETLPEVDSLFLDFLMRKEWEEKEKWDNLRNEIKILQMASSGNVVGLIPQDDAIDKLLFRDYILRKHDSKSYLKKSFFPFLLPSEGTLIW